MILPTVSLLLSLHPVPAMAAGPFQEGGRPVSRSPEQGGRVKSPPAQGGKGKKKQEKPKPPVWPKIKFVRKSIARDKIVRLASKDPKVVEEARRKILSFGPGVCPVLLAGLHDRQKPAIRKKLEDLLDRLTTEKFAPQLSLAYLEKNEVRSLYVVARLASFERKDLLPFFKRASRHKNSAISDRARYAMASLGEIDTLAFLMEKAMNRWEEENYDIRSSLPALKSVKTTKVLLSHLAKKDLGTQIAALRLLHGAGTTEALGPVGDLLDSETHALRIAAVNCLRGIVDGDPPYRHLPVFKAIEVVKAWKRRLGK